LENGLLAALHFHPTRSGKEYVIENTAFPAIRYAISAFRLTPKAKTL